MKTFKLPFSETEIDVNNEGVITRVNGFDFICNILEMKLSEYRLMDLDNKGSHMFPYWLDMFIQEIGTSLPENNDDFEKIVRTNWEQWNTDDVLIGTQLDHYQFGDEHMAHDMKDYYGELRANGDLFQRRWDFAIADIEVRIKSEHMSKRISLKLTDKNDWLVDKLNEEKEKQNRPSFNNMVETILVEYFEERGQKIKTATENVNTKQ